MFDRVIIRVSDIAASERFYGTVLGSIGIEPQTRGDTFIEWGEFSIAEATADDSATSGLHVGFSAQSRGEVDEFWQAGINAGYEDDGAPGERPQYKPDYYGGFLLDPDGNSIEAGHHEDIRHGVIDHLWIGVADLGESFSFYRSIAGQTGLREGVTWEGGRQFRGAWATFSLVADGRPATRNLTMAFPVPFEDVIDVHDPDGNRVRTVFRG